MTYQKKAEAHIGQNVVSITINIFVAASHQTGFDTRSVT